MTDCLHRELCPNECPCDYYVSQKDVPKDYTVLVPDFKGSYIVYAHCENCGQPVQHLTERVYDC